MKKHKQSHFDSFPTATSIELSTEVVDLSAKILAFFFAELPQPAYAKGADCYHYDDSEGFICSVQCVPTANGVIKTPYAFGHYVISGRGSGGGYWEDACCEIEQVDVNATPIHKTMSDKLALYLYQPMSEKQKVFWDSLWRTKQTDQADYYGNGNYYQTNVLIVEELVSAVLIYGFVPL